MASITFKYKGASAKLRQIDEETRRYLISNLWSKAPRNGYAREVIQMIVDHADKFGWILEVVAQQYGRLDSRGMNNKQLVAFYESFGFVPLRKKPPIKMERLPQ